MLSAVSALAGLIGLAISIFLLAWQTRAVAEQTRITNSISGASTVNASLSDLREVLMIFVEHPELRAYFYDRKQCPTSETERSVVISVGEMFADLLTSALHSTTLVSATNSYEDWADYSRYLLANSPVLAELVRTYPQWWPSLARVAEQ